MTERRRWKAEEKLALINEIREKGQIVETCRKYGVDPSILTGVYSSTAGKRYSIYMGWIASDREQGIPIPA